MIKLKFFIKLEFQLLNFFDSVDWRMCTEKALSLPTIVILKTKIFRIGNLQRQAIIDSLMVRFSRNPVWTLRLVVCKHTTRIKPPKLTPPVFSFTCRPKLHFPQSALFAMTWNALKFVISN